MHRSPFPFIERHEIRWRVYPNSKKATDTRRAPKIPTNSVNISTRLTLVCVFRSPHQFGGRNAAPCLPFLLPRDLEIRARVCLDFRRAVRSFDCFWHSLKSSSFHSIAFSLSLSFAFAAGPIHTFIHATANRARTHVSLSLNLCLARSFVPCAVCAVAQRQKFSCATVAIALERAASGPNSLFGFYRVSACVFRLFILWLPFVVVSFGAEKPGHDGSVARLPFCVC